MSEEKNPATRLLPQDKPQLSRAHILDSMEIMRAHYVRHQFAPHMHDEYAIGIIEYGEQEIAYRQDRNMRMPEGTIAALNAGEMHSGRATTDKGWAYRMIYPSRKLISEIADELGISYSEAPVFTKGVIEDPELFMKIRAMHEILSDPDAPIMEKEAAFVDVMGLMIARHTEPGPLTIHSSHNRKLVTRAADYIHEYYKEPLGLTTLADIAGMSRYHFCRSFKKVFGLPPHAYQVQRRIMEAKKLLQNGTPIVEAALSVGFFDQSHFGRHFKRAVGVTPGQYIH